MITHNKAKKIDFYVIHTGMVDFSVTPLGCSNLSHSHMINPILHNKYMAHLCKHFHMPEYATSNHALFTYVFCRPDVIHVPCNILEYHLVWPFRFVAVFFFTFRSVAFSVCGRFEMWPFSVCGRFGLWPFRFVAVSVCGRFGLWPFWFVIVSVCGRFGCGLSVCGRYDL